MLALRSETEEAKNSAEEKKSATEKTVAADTKYLENLKQSCAAKSSEWPVHNVKLTRARGSARR